MKLRNLYAGTALALLIVSAGPSWSQDTAQAEAEAQAVNREQVEESVTAETDSRRFRLVGIAGAPWLSRQPASRSGASPARFRHTGPDGPVGLAAGHPSGTGHAETVLRALPEGKVRHGRCRSGDRRFRAQGLRSVSGRSPKRGWQARPGSSAPRALPPSASRQASCIALGAGISPDARPAPCAEPFPPPCRLDSVGLCR